MKCPGCQEQTEPLRGSTWILAIYWCAKCGECWSAKIRDGRPVAGTVAAIRKPLLN